MPARSRSRVLAPAISVPASSTDPVEGRRPIRASQSSVCPLPCTPAMPRISPARTSKDIESTARPPYSAGTVRSRTSSMTSAGQLRAAGARWPLGDDFAAAEHRDAVGYGLDLAELMRDEDDRPAAVAQLAHDLEQVLGLAGRQYRRWLVQHEHPGVPEQRLDDLDPLLHAHGQVLDVGIGVDPEPEAL